MTSKEYRLIDSALEKCKNESKKSTKNVPIKIEIKKDRFYIFASDMGKSIIVAVKLIDKTSFKQFKLICDMIYKHYNCIFIQDCTDAKSVNIPKKFDKFRLRKLLIEN